MDCTHQGMQPMNVHGFQPSQRSSLWKPGFACIISLLIQPIWGLSNRNLTKAPLFSIAKSKILSLAKFYPYPISRQDRAGIQPSNKMVACWQQSAMICTSHLPTTSPGLLLHPLLCTLFEGGGVSPVQLPRITVVVQKKVTALAIILNVFLPGSIWGKSALTLLCCHWFITGCDPMSLDKFSSKLSQV